MDKEEVIQFFNEQAGHWDADMIKNDETIYHILDVAQIYAHKRILDVACGTGVMIPYYLQRDVSHITGVDISPNMIAAAREKFSSKNVDFMCCDITDFHLDMKFDCIMIYNAYPHFINGEEVIRELAMYLDTGGTLTIAHGMGREAINQHHSGVAHHVSADLCSGEDLAEIMKKYLTVCEIADEKEFFIVSGKKN